MRLDTLRHLTTNTGHVRDSARDEVGDDIVDLLRPLVRAGGGTVPGPIPGYTLAIRRTGRRARYEVRDASGGLVLACVLDIGAATLDVTLHDFARPDDLHWLADLERCVAWTIIEETQ